MTNNSDNTSDNKLAIGAADQHLIAVEYDDKGALVDIPYSLITNQILLTPVQQASGQEQLKAITSNYEGIINHIDEPPWPGDATHTQTTEQRSQQGDFMGQRFLLQPAKGKT
ncbi:MAG: hypothetical protein GY787_15670, partial [Alteromonadales bacterium]|nr:hypothetical protein [Alteromonadales bacterium]